jgi:putative transposase
VKFQWVHDHREQFRNVADVELMCQVLGVSRTGYYAWVKRPPSTRHVRREELITRIRTMF